MTRADKAICYIITASTAVAFNLVSSWLGGSDPLAGGLNRLTGLLLATFIAVAIFAIIPGGFFRSDRYGAGALGKLAALVTLAVYLVASYFGVTSSWPLGAILVATISLWATAVFLTWNTFAAKSSPAMISVGVGGLLYGSASLLFGLAVLRAGYTLLAFSVFLFGITILVAGFALLRDELPLLGAVLLLFGITALLLGFALLRDVSLLLGVVVFIFGVAALLPGIGTLVLGLAIRRGEEGFLLGSSALVFGVMFVLSGFAILLFGFTVWLLRGAVLLYMSTVLGPSMRIVFEVLTFIFVIAILGFGVLILVFGVFFLWIRRIVRTKGIRVKRLPERPSNTPALLRGVQFAFGTLILLVGFSFLVCVIVALYFGFTVLGVVALPLAAAVFLLGLSDLLSGVVSRRLNSLQSEEVLVKVRRFLLGKNAVGTG